MLFDAFNTFNNSCAIKGCRDNCYDIFNLCCDKTLNSKKKEKRKKNNLNKIKK